MTAMHKHGIHIPVEEWGLFKLYLSSPPRSNEDLKVKEAAADVIRKFMKRDAFFDEASVMSEMLDFWMNRHLEFQEVYE